MLTRLFNFMPNFVVRTKWRIVRIHPRTLHRQVFSYTMNGRIVTNCVFFVNTVGFRCHFRSVTLNIVWVETLVITILMRITRMACVVTVGVLCREWIVMRIVQPILHLTKSRIVVNLRVLFSGHHTLIVMCMLVETPNMMIQTTVNSIFNPSRPIFIHPESVAHSTRFSGVFVKFVVV